MKKLTKALTVLLALCFSLCLLISCGDQAAKGSEKGDKDKINMPIDEDAGEIPSGPEEELYPNESYYLIDDFITNLKYWRYSGWDYDYTGSSTVGSHDAYIDAMYDSSKEDHLSLSRTFNDVEKDGHFTLEAVYTLGAGKHVDFQFINESGDIVFSAGFKSGKAYIGDIQTETTLEMVLDKTDVRMRINFSLDENYAECYMGPEYIGKIDIAENSSFNQLKIVTGPDEKKSNVTMKNCHLFKNYAVNDVFRMEKVGAVPLGYETVGAKVFKMFSNAANTNDVSSVKIDREGHAKKNFAKVSGDKVILAAYILPVTGEDGTYFSLKCEGNTILYFHTKDGNWYVGDTKLTSFTKNVWQWIRVEANTFTDTCDIKINGKYVAKDVKFAKEIPYFNGLEIGSKSQIWFDDVEVYKEREYEDYVPVPQPLDTGDYILSMSVCNLWRNGSHMGWEWIAPFAELEPVTGYYDEGNPESMDWEIKFLVEHGITNYALCWYPLVDGGNVPIKKPRMSDALHDGYFNAKYSDMMTFNLMFENTGYDAGSLDDFKNNVFPFILDWYFKDSRYLKITKDDGKEYVLFTVYQFDRWLKMAGDTCTRTDHADGSFSYQYTTEKSNELLAWMNEQVKNAGVADGIILSFSGNLQSESGYAAMGAAGAEAFIPYTYSRLINANDNYQKRYVMEHYATTSLNGFEMLAFPTASFNDMAWNDNTRQNTMKTKDYEEMLEWYRDKYMTKLTDWRAKFIQFGTWNEYGEGHNLYPTVGVYKKQGYGGYGYLDAIANVFGAEKHDKTLDITPTDAQKARINRLFNGNRQMIARDQLEKPQKGIDIKIVIDEIEYLPFDSMEVREITDTEIYMAPQDKQDFYRLLHIVYVWNRKTGKLSLDTPNGTTFDFTVGSDIVLVNGEEQKLEKPFEVFDAAPVIPVLFILDNAGYKYTLNDANNYLYIYVTK